jgi:membrane-anchored glycerophosphoryl diester phosphodiesterase (GDPDase)
VLFVVIGAVEAVIWAPMIRQWPTPPAPDTILRSFTPAYFIPAFFVLTLLFLALFSIYLAAASYASTRADSGVKTAFRQAYGLAWRRGGRHLWLLVLCYLYAFLPLLVVEVAAALAAAALVRGGGTASPAIFILIPLAVLFYLASVAYGIIMALRLSLTFPACVEEDLAVRAAVGRSFQLTRGAKGRIFLVVLVIYAALYAAIMVVELAVMFLVAICFFAGMALHAQWSTPWGYAGAGFIIICAFAAIVLFTSLTYATLVTALAILYHDQRLRTDGPLAAPPQSAGLE